MSIQHSVQSSRISATEKMFGFHVKLLLIAVIASYTVDAVQFSCKFLVYRIPHIGRVYGCGAKLILTESTILESVTGVHQLGQTNDNVESLEIYHQYLTFFPQGIANVFKNLRAIDFFNTNLFSISAEDLKPFPQLEYFRMTRSNLTSLDGDLFSFTPFIKYVNMDFNKIQHIGQDLVTNLNHLQFLDLERNTCIHTNAYNRSAVVKLAPQLSVLCPPLDITTTAATTTTLN